MYSAVINDSEHTQDNIHYSMNTDIVRTTLYMYTNLYHLDIKNMTR